MTYVRQTDRRDLPRPSGLSIVSSDFRVLALHADSRFVPVGAPSRELHWIPSAMPMPGEARIDSLFAESRVESFDIERIEVMEHAADHSPESGKDIQ